LDHPAIFRLNCRVPGNEGSAAKNAGKYFQALYDDIQIYINFALLNFELRIYSMCNFASYLPLLISLLIAFSESF